MKINNLSYSFAYFFPILIVHEIYLALLITGVTNNGSRLLRIMLFN